MTTYLRSPSLCSPENCSVLVVDMQEKLLPVIHQSEELLKQCCRLLKGITLLDIPILATEQYPQGLGRTVPEISPSLTNPVEKKRFSSVESLELPCAGDRNDNRTSMILVGIEAHVCILQTAFDLQSLGYDVILPVDAISSRNELDQAIAFRRMEGSGMTLTTVESLLFELCETADHPKFKQLSRIVTGRDKA